jgi:flavodoxin
MKTLIVYYSGTGSNKALAENITNRLTADIEGLGGGGNMEGIGVAVTAFKSLLGLGSGIGKLKYDPSAYDLVVLASPVYAGGVPPQMSSYLNRFKGKIKKAAIASVSGSGKNPKAIEKMEKLVGSKAIAVLELKGIEDKSGPKKGFQKLTAMDLEKLEYREKIDAFIQEIL